MLENVISHFLVVSFLLWTLFSKTAWGKRLQGVFLSLHEKPRLERFMKPWEGIFSGGVEEMKIIMTIKEIACRYTKLNFPVISYFRALDA